MIIPFDFVPKGKVNIAPLGVKGWDGALRAHPRGWSKLLDLLCVGS
jgi:hypothetical protein